MYPNDPEIQELWLQCILPLVDDSKDGIQSAALSLLERFFLLGLVTSVEFEKDVSMALLEKLTSINFLVYHKFMKKAFSQ